MSLKVVKGRGGEAPDSGEFRIPASDAKGHTTRLWFRCVPMMGRLIEQTIQSKRFPYRTRGDLLRHALHRHMKWLDEVGEVNSTCGMVDAMLDVLRDEQMQEDFDHVFRRLDDRIESHIGSGNGSEATRLILLITSHINQMPSGFWKEKYKREIKRKYGGHLQDAYRANLGKMDDD